MTKRKQIYFGSELLSAVQEAVNADEDSKNVSQYVCAAVVEKMQNDGQDVPDEIRKYDV